MAAELRWILLALSLVLLAGIWWWGQTPFIAGSRRCATARDNTDR